MIEVCLNPGSSLVEDQHRGRDHRGPQAALVAHAALGDVGGADDFVGDAVNLFFLVPGSIRIEFHVERGGEHLRGQFFSIFAGNVVGFADYSKRPEMARGSADDVESP